MTTADTTPPKTGLATHGDEQEPKGEHTSTTACCSHHESKLENWILVYLFGGMFVLTTTVMKLFGLADEQLADIPAFIGSVLLFAGLAVPSFKELYRGSPSTSSLAALAVFAAITIGKYEEAGYVAFILLTFDHALRRTAWGARNAIEELVGLTPDTARVVEDGVEREVPLGDVREGTVVRVRPGENLPVDGVVTSGVSSINQASLTGEALPVDVEPGTNVYAGTTNLTSVIDLRTTLVGEETTIGKVAELIAEAEASRTSRQLLIEQVARYFVPIALVTCLLVLYLTSDFERAITVLIVVCPAALLLSSPTAMMAAFAAAARLGIMVKQTTYLEAAADVDTIVFDKTGTLTTGKFAVSRLAPAEGVDGAELLKAAADAEQASNHPLATSIMHTATKARITPDANVSAEEVHGAGVRAQTSDGEVLAGRPGWLVEMNPGIRSQVDDVEAQIEGMSGVHVMRGGRYLGAVGLEDRLRYNARGVIGKLRELGARSITLMTGDRFAVAKRVGKTVSVDRIEAECLPEEKHRLVGEMVSSGKRVLMVGDGINDGPSLAAADVGVAMGLHGSDIATNSAGVALMNDDISRVPFLVMLARRTRAIIAQNIAASIVIALAGLALAATGALEIGFAALYHFLGEIFVLANSFRLVRFGEDFAASDQFASSGQPQGRPGRRPASEVATPPAGAAALSG